MEQPWFQAVENFRAKAREILRNSEDQIDKGIDEEDTRNAVSTLEDYFANVDRVVDLSSNIEYITTV